MNKRPTDDQIQETIQKLKELERTVKPHTIFGDDNVAAVHAQREVLEEDLTEEDIYDRWPDDEDEYIREAAFNALSWLDGDSEESITDWPTKED